MNALFYGLEAKWFASNRAYRIYEGNGNIVGIRVGGQFYNKTSVRTQLAGLYLTLIGIPVVEVFAAWADRRRIKAEEVANDNFGLAQDRKDSKVLALSEVGSVGLSTRRTWWTIAKNSGTVTIRYRNGSYWKLILTGKQDMEKIAMAFETLGIVIDNRHYKES